MTDGALPATVEPTEPIRPQAVPLASAAIPSVAQATPVIVTDGPRRDEGFPQKILNVGFIFGLGLAGLALVMTGFYLGWFLASTDSSLERLFEGAAKSSLSQPTFRISITARMILIKMALRSCGIFVGLAFGFLGFSLFLLGIRGDMDVDARSESYRVRLSRMYPGVFVILCATVLVAICVLNSTDFSYTLAGGEDAAQGDAGAIQKPGQDATPVEGQAALKAVNQQRSASVLDAVRGKAETPKEP
jgi:hypothetical protein